jgi:transposase-like protein
MAAARAFIRSAKAVTGVMPGRVTTDGHDSYPRVIRSELGRRVRHRTSCYSNNREEERRSAGYVSETNRPTHALRRRGDEVVLERLSFACGYHPLLWRCDAA